MVALVADSVAAVIELFCIGIILVGTTHSLIVAMPMVRRHEWDSAYKRIRLSYGRTLLLSLEFLIGAEVLHTVAMESATAILLLATVVIIRALLGIALEVEVQGRFPWTRHHSEIATQERSALVHERAQAASRRPAPEASPQSSQG